MTQVFKTVWLSFWKRYYPQWILANLILAICLPFFSIMAPDVGLSFSIGLGFVAVTIFVIIMSLVFNGYMYHARQAAFQFSLPIQRLSLFWANLSLVILLACLPAWLNFGLTLIINHAEPNLWLSMISITIHIIFVACAGALTACLAKRMLDAIPVYLFYVSLPIATLVFIIMLLAAVPVAGYGNYYENIAEQLVNVFLPMKGFSLGYILFYGLLAGVYLWLAYRYMKKLAVEEIGTKTTHVLTYPLLVMIVTGMMSSLTIYAYKYSAYFMAAIVLIIYLSLVFYAKQEIYINLKLIVNFIIIQAIAAGLTFTVFHTHAFGMIYEVPKQPIEQVRIEMIYKEKIYRFVTDKPMYIEQMKQLQKKCIHQELTSAYTSIDFEYQTKNNEVVRRNYSVQYPKEVIQLLKNIDESTLQISELSNGYYYG